MYVVLGHIVVNRDQIITISPLSVGHGTTVLDILLSGRQGIPEKGKILAQLSVFWFRLLEDVMPNHFVTDKIDDMPPAVQKYRDQLEGRAMLVRRLNILPIEAIVRGYLAGKFRIEHRGTGKTRRMKSQF